MTTRLGFGSWAAIAVMAFVSSAAPAPAAGITTLRDASPARALRVLATPGGGVVVLGHSGTESWLAELSPGGEVVRQVRIVNASAVELEGMIATPDGGLV